MDSRRLELIADVARLYYEKEMNVKEIAALYDTSASSISRLLQEAKDLKIVQVVIRYPFLTDPVLSQQLKQHLGLKEAHVLPNFRGKHTQVKERVGQLAARVLEEHLEEGMTLGVSLGVMVGYTARAFQMSHNIHCTVVRLHGANDNEIVEGNNLAQIFSAQLGNQFKIIPSPFIMQSRAAYELILQEPSVRENIRIAEECDIALVGLGSLDPSVSTMLRNHLLTKELLAELRQAGAVGEICGKYYNAEGVELENEFNRRTVAINLHKLRQMRFVIGVAVGSAKVQPILGAAQGKLINILVTDAETALLLLKAAPI